MLSFDSSLSNALKLGNTTAFWVLKLYYNADTTSSNFIGVSDSHRVDGSDIYYGIVASWGQYQQSLNFFNFTTSTGNMTVSLINTDRSIQGGRFSDLLSTNNFANRKWELFQNTSQAGTYDTAARMIGTGIISGDIQYDYTSVKFTLLDSRSKYQKQLPTNIVDSTTFPNAPEKNINKPIPMVYGDFHAQDGIGTIPSSTARFDRHFTKSKFPAIITDVWDETNSYVEAKCDKEDIKTLDTDNVYIYNDAKYSSCISTNVTIDTSPASLGVPNITFKGMTWLAYFQLRSDSNGNAVDNDFSSEITISTTGSSATKTFAIPKLPNLGIVSAVNIFIDYNGTTGDDNDVTQWRIGHSDSATSFSLGLSGTEEKVVVTNWFTTADKDSWDFEGQITITLNSATSTSYSIKIVEIGLEVEYAPSQNFEKEIQESYEVIVGENVNDQFNDSDISPETLRLSRTVQQLIPGRTDYVYYSGEGRIFGAWIDTIDSAARTDGNGGEPDPNYDANDLIENPVYMIEDILRTELGLDSSTDGSDIDIESFDRSGNAQTGSTKGDIALTFNDAVADIKFAFSQYKFINSKDMIDKICKQICSWVWISGDGRFKIRTLLRSTDTFSADKTIDFADINLKSISRTRINTVRNDITVNYNHDYGQDQNLSQVNTTDSTSQGTTVNGNNQTLKLVIDADGILDSTTATQLADAYKAILKDRKVILNFNCVRPLYNDLEIGDIITFDNWDTNLKLYGTAFSSDFFIVQDIAKRTDSCSIKAIKVD